MLAKFGLCSICSQNLNECLLAHARKIFALDYSKFRKSFALYSRTFSTEKLNSHKDKTKRRQGNLKITQRVLISVIIIRNNERNLTLKLNKDSCKRKQVNEGLTARQLYFLKCSLLARQIWSLLVLLKYNAVVSRMLGTNAHENVLFSVITNSESQLLIFCSYYTISLSSCL